jgi:hypothetical protein
MSEQVTIPQTESVRRGHEPSTVHVRAIAIFGGVLVFVVAVVGVIAWVSLTTRSVHPKEAPPVAGTRLQDDEAADMRELRREVEAALEGYGWVDRDGGVVRIPIERAMRLYVERHAVERAEAGRDAEGGER